MRVGNHYKRGAKVHTPFYWWNLLVEVKRNEGKRRKSRLGFSMANREESLSE